MWLVELPVWGLLNLDGLVPNFNVSYYNLEDSQQITGLLISGLESLGDLCEKGLPGGIVNLSH